MNAGLDFAVPGHAALLVYTYSGYGGVATLFAERGSQIQSAGMAIKQESGRPRSIGSQRLNVREPRHDQGATRRARELAYLWQLTARRSFALLICQRPSLSSFLGSAYNCSRVRLLSRLVPERWPPRDEMS